MSTINSRIQFLVDHFTGGNNLKFAQLIGTSEANIRNYIKETSPKSNFLETLCEKLDVSGEWLIMGEGCWKRGTENYSGNEVAEEESINEKVDKLISTNEKRELQVLNLINFHKDSHSQNMKIIEQNNEIIEQNKALIDHLIGIDASLAVNKLLVGQLVDNFNLTFDKNILKQIEKLTKIYEKHSNAEA